MTFQDIPPGQSLFVDANILIFYFRPDPLFGPACDQLLRRIESGDLQGFTSAHVVSETAHRLMADEAVSKFAWPTTGIARKLRAHPAQVQTLTRHRQAIDELSLIGLQILSVTGSQVSSAADISCQHGLLSSDALVVSVMKSHGLTALASHDADFDRIPGIVRYSPV